jgi:hypothetical protein
MITCFTHLKNVATCPKVLAYEQDLERLGGHVCGIPRSGRLQPEKSAFGVPVPPPLNPHGVLQLCLLGSPTFQDTPHEQSLWDRRVSPPKLVECAYRHKLIESWGQHLLTYEGTCHAIEETWSIQSRMRGRVVDGLRFARDTVLQLKEQGTRPKSPKLKGRRAKEDAKILEQAIMLVTELDDEDYRHLKWDQKTRPFARSPLDHLSSQVRRNSKAYEGLLWNMRESFREYGPNEGGKRYPDQAMFYAMAEVLIHVGVKDTTTTDSLARTIQKALWSLEHPAQRGKTVKIPPA